MKQHPEDLEARIAAYIDGELSPAEAARLEVFLANTDPKLAEQVIGMIAEKHAVKHLPRERAPEDLAARIMEQVERTTLLSDVEHFSAPRRPWWQGRLAIAAGLLLVVGGFTWFIVQAIVRPDTPWRDAMMEPARSKTLASAPGEANAPGERQVATLDAQHREQERAVGGAVKRELGSTTQLASAAEGEKDLVSPAAPLARARALKAPAAENAATEPHPVMLTLVARDAAEYNRLRTMLTEWSGQAPAPAAAPAAAAAADGNASQSGTPTLPEQQELFPQSQQVQAPVATPPDTAAASPEASSQALQNSSAAMNSNAGERNAAAAASLVQNVAPATERFSLTLRPDQLALLTHKFRVQGQQRQQFQAAGGTLASAAATTQKAAGAINSDGATPPQSAELPSNSPAASVPCVVTIIQPSQEQMDQSATEPAAQ